MSRPALVRLGRAATLAIALLVGGVRGASAAQAVRHAMTGMVLEVDRQGGRFVVSHDAVPGVMSAMTMAFEVREPRELAGVEPGALVAFTLVMDGASILAERIEIRRYESGEQDPFTARRLKLLTDLTRGSTDGNVLAAGQAVPDFTLIDQTGRRVTLSALRGKVVAINFVYTSCALPQFCFRIANHFGVLQSASVSGSRPISCC